ncbi:unnamed protein product [Lactuca virosa]|uniref:Uncharacterized protein n=1 Tax=Lactuca virosa TaxID=75947 RepID=A0AAU9N8A9_9ASTR|nr:unnamed protein product [Lactuca virosa]
MSSSSSDDSASEFIINHLTISLGSICYHPQHHLSCRVRHTFYNDLLQQLLPLTPLLLQTSLSPSFQNLSSNSSNPFFSAGTNPVQNH